MNFSRNNLLTTYRFCLMIMQLTSMQYLIFDLSFQIVIYNPITSNKLDNVVPPVCSPVVILCRYLKKRNPRSCVVAVTVKN